MVQLDSILNKYPALQDQLDLLEETITDYSILTESHIKIVAWSSCLQTKDKEITKIIVEKVGKLTTEEEKVVTISTSRMSVTNPYFMGRSVHPVNAGGSLDALRFQQFEALDISDKIGYHYSCIAFALLNGGFMCFNSHVTSLERLQQKAEAIDQALRLAVAIVAIRQTLSNKLLLNI